MSLTLFIIFFLLKQFYIFPSGGPGIADIFLIACFLWLLAKALSARANVSRLPHRQDYALYLFLACVLLINTIYGILTHNTVFFKYSAFWLYNGCAIWSFRELADHYGKRFFFLAASAAKVSMILQFLIYLSGKGRLFYEYWGATRYMGTFNDPNQLAFFLFMMVLLCYLFQCQYRDKTFCFFYILGTIMIAASKSTGILLGMIVFTACVCLYRIWLLYQSGRFPNRFWIFSLTCVTILGILFLVWLWPSADFDVHATEYNMITRIQDKIWKIMNGGLNGLILDRGLDKFILYPQYLLFGAGEGGFERFALAAQVHEIHSCLPSIWFCYGIVPTIVFIFWLSKTLKKNTPQMWCAIIGLLFESFFLINYRQPIFWLILIYGSISVQQREPHT